MPDIFTNHSSKIYNMKMEEDACSEDPSTDASDDSVEVRVVPIGGVKYPLLVSPIPLTTPQEGGKSRPNRRKAAEPRRRPQQGSEEELEEDSQESKEKIAEETGVNLKRSIEDDDERNNPPLKTPKLEEGLPLPSPIDPLSSHSHVFAHLGVPHAGLPLFLPPAWPSLYQYPRLVGLHPMGIATPYPPLLSLLPHPAPSSLQIPTQLLPKEQQPLSLVSSRNKSPLPSTSPTNQPPSTTPCHTPCRPSPKFLSVESLLEHTSSGKTKKVSQQNVWGDVKEPKRKGESNSPIPQTPLPPHHKPPPASVIRGSSPNNNPGTPSIPAIDLQLQSPPLPPGTPSRCPNDSPKAKQRNYKNMTRERRIEANARERTRVHTISAAFERLRQCVPAYSHTQKLSKLSVLRIAAEYILALSKLSGGEGSSLSPSNGTICSQGDTAGDHWDPTFADCIDRTTRTLQIEGKAKKRKEE